MLRTLAARLTDGPRDEAGITLVELMVVVLIMGVVGGMTTTSLVQGMRTTDRVDVRIQASTGLQQAAERVARDLRRGVWTDISVSPLPTPPSGCTYISVDPENLSVVVFDGADRYRHSYALVDGTLSLDVDEWAGSGWTDVSNQTVITGLNNVAAGVDLFTFLDRGGASVLDDGFQADDRSDVRNFRLTLVGSVRDQPDMTVSTTVAARNGGLTCPVAS